MYGYIYKTTNLLNGKIYVGQHKANKFDINYFGSGTILLNIINKYGTDNLKCEILDVCEDENELNEKEIYWIAKLNATDRSIGYNLMSGGYRIRGIKHSESTKRKISKSRTGIIPNREWIVTEDTKKQISNTLKEYYKTHDNPRKGVHLSDETKEKLRQANLGKKYSEEVKAKKRGRPAWNRGIPMTEEQKKHLSEINKEKNKNRIIKGKTVGQFDLSGNLIATYVSCADASRKTNIPRVAITKGCLGYRKVSYGYKWKYLDEQLM